MILEKTLEEVENRPIQARPAPILQAVYVSVLAAVILVLGVFWNSLSEVASVKGVDAFHAMPARIDHPQKVAQGDR